MRTYLLFCCIIFPEIALAVPAQGIGDIANNMLAPVYIVSNFVGSASLILGITLLFASVIRYIEFRKNQLASPISTVIVLFLLGLMLLCLPFLYKLTDSGVPYPLH